MESSKQAKSSDGRRLLIAGNWKMYKTPDEARSLAAEIAAGLPGTDQRQVAIFPPAVSLALVADAVRTAAHEVIVGAQNMHFEEQGAFTGEISADMILAAGGTAVLLGHSERRHVFGESDELVGKKVATALCKGLTPVLCVGEKLDEREADKTTQVVSRQLAAGIEGVKNAADLARIVFAYEPVWAIGTGRTATPQQGQEVHAVLRARLAERFASLGAAQSAAEESLILYGGSVKPDNAADILAEPDIDGLLVGGASLKADSFLKICAAGL